MSNIMPPSSEVAMGLSEGQMGWLTDQLRYGLRKSTVFRGTPTAKVDEFIKTAGRDWRDSYVQQLEEDFEDLTGRHRVPVDYDETNAIAQAIEAGEFDDKYLGVPLADIPSVGQGQVVRLVHEVHFGRVMCDHALPAALQELGREEGCQAGYKFADPLTALRFAARRPDRQRKHPLGILFYDTKGQLCYLYLNEVAALRSLYVGWSDPGGCWYGNVRFLAVGEEPLAS